MAGTSLLLREGFLIEEQEIAVDNQFFDVTLES